MRAASARPTAGGSQSDTASGGRGARAWLTPVNAVIVGATLVALGLRLYQLSTPGYLFGVTEYDDGSYFGSAIRLVHGMLPYRDFIFVQPPGITLLMSPVALLTRVTSTQDGLAIARILTTLVSAAGVFALGWLVRHRGVVVTILACGLLTFYPDAVYTSFTLLLEPWLVLFCLLAAIAVFEGDQLTGNKRRLVLGGLALGFAGAIEAWAIVPALVILVLCLPKVRRAGYCLAGMAVGFLVPVIPFAALAPKDFFRDLIVAQVGPRHGAVRVGLWFRLREMFGLTNISVNHSTEILWVLVVLAFAVCALAAMSLVSQRLPSALEWFGLVTTVLVIAMFLYPAQFWFHFVAFLVPFLALAVALPAGRLVDAAQKVAARSGTQDVVRWFAAGLTGLLILLFGLSEISAVYHTANRRVVAGAAADRSRILATLDRVAAPGSCVLTDQVSYTIVANRFISSVPGCSTLDDGTGMDLALGHGLKPSTGAGNVPAVAAVWRDAFDHAQFVLLSAHYFRRVAWNASLRTYFASNFHLLQKVPTRDALYVRNGTHLR